MSLVKGVAVRGIVVDEAALNLCRPIDGGIRTGLPNDNAGRSPRTAWIPGLRQEAATLQSATIFFAGDLGLRMPFVSLSTKKRLYEWGEKLGCFRRGAVCGTRERMHRPGRTSGGLSQRLGAPHRLLRLGLNQWPHDRTHPVF